MSQKGAKESRITQPWNNKNANQLVWKLLNSHLTEKSEYKAQTFKICVMLIITIETTDGTFYKIG